MKDNDELPLFSDQYLANRQIAAAREIEREIEEIRIEHEPNVATLAASTVWRASVNCW
jgi:hypothetical protein